MGQKIAESMESMTYLYLCTKASTRCISAHRETRTWQRESSDSSPSSAPCDRGIQCFLVVDCENEPQGTTKLVLVFLGFLLVAVVATYPLALRATDHVFGLGTPPLNIWAMAWVNHQLPREPLSLFDANAFYPYARSLAFSEHLFVPSLMAAPWLAVTGNPVLAHNAVALLSLALAGLGMYLLCRELTGSETASYAAGLLYAFHTWNINELIRIQILSNQWFPFVLLALIRYFRSPSTRRSLAVGAAYALQGLSCMYWALYLPLVVGPAMILLQWRNRLEWRRLVLLGLPLGLAISMIGLFAVPYLQNRQEFSFERELPNSVSIDRYFDVLPNNWLYEDSLGTARANENAAHFLGFSTMLIALLGVFARSPTRIDLRLLWLTFVLAGFVLSLGPEIWLGERRLMAGPYAALFHWLPGFQSVRYPERFSLIMMLGVAPLLAGGLARLRPIVGGFAVVAISALVFIEHLSVPLKLTPLPAGEEIPNVYRWIAEQPDVNVVAEVPTTRHWGERADAEPMYFSTVHWKRTVQGFTGYFPPAYNYIRWRLFHFPDRASVSFLEKLGVDTIVVRPETLDVDALAGNEAWKLDGPFPGGHVALRLKQARGLHFETPDKRGGPPLVELDPTSWRVHGSTPGAVRAKDRDPGTSWSTSEFQTVDDFYAIRFPEVTRPARVSMLAGPPFEFPMHFEILGLLESGAWQSLDFEHDPDVTYDRFVAKLLRRPLEATLDVALDPPPVREIRIRITKTDPFEMPWTLSEVHIYTRRAQ